MFSIMYTFLWSPEDPYTWSIMFLLRWNFYWSRIKICNSITYKNLQHNKVKIWPQLQIFIDHVYVSFMEPRLSVYVIDHVFASMNFYRSRIHFYMWSIKSCNSVHIFIRDRIANFYTRSIKICNSGQIFIRYWVANF